VKNAECAADDGLTFVVALDELLEFVRDGVQHMDEDDPGYDEIGRFETFNLSILRILVEDATEAFTEWLTLRRIAKKTQENGRRCTEAFDRILISAIRERDQCLNAIREIVNEPSTRILRGIGYTYHRIVQYINDVAMKATKLVSETTFFCPAVN
jgi:predicted adenine nucleotide alpha hydrolase (AANH) superfamily ATPase